MAFWIFKFNPDRYRFADRLADPEPSITWTVKRYRDEIGPGDTVFMWETGPNRGIKAIMQVDRAPSLMFELEREQEYWQQRDTAEEWRVFGTLTQRDLNLTHTELRETPGLENLSVFHGFQQGTNFPVTPGEGTILLNLATRAGSDE